MKKILYLVSTLKKSGPIMVLTNIVKHLERDKYEPLVLTLSPEPKESLKEYFQDELQIQVHSLNLSRIEGLFFAKRKINNFIIENDISLIHSHGFRPDLLISGLSFEIKKIATLHNYPYYDYVMTYGKFKGLIMSKLHLNALKKFDAPVVVSQSISNMLMQKNNYNISYVRNGTDMDRFINLDKEKLRAKLGFSKDDVLLISVGHLSSRKDPLTIIKAFEKLNKENCKLIFLGDGPLTEVCKQSVFDENNIKILGRVDNVHEYFGASDYFISASLAEGLPNAVLEAMASKLPCVLSDIPPHMEINSLETKSSKIFKQNDYNDCKEKLNQIFNENYDLMSSLSKDNVEKNFTAKIMSSEYQNIYSKLLTS